MIRAFIKCIFIVGNSISLGESLVDGEYLGQSKKNRKEGRGVWYVSIVFCHRLHLILMLYKLSSLTIRISDTLTDTFCGANDAENACFAEWYGLKPVIVR